jgi:polyhydroxyalkanoate synthase subunit PhaC
MSAAADVNLADIPERIQFEVQRAIQRSIKGVEYFSTSGLHLARRQRTSCTPAAR